MWTNRTIFIAGILFSSLAWGQPGGGGVVISPVGDAETFGDEVIYLGSVQTEGVALQATCPSPPEPTGRCIELEPVPGTTFVDESDLGSIELPKKATDSLICFAFTPLHTWQFSNPTGSTQTAMQFFRGTIRIESDVLDGLSDPVTGDPYNGAIELSLTTSLDQRTIEPGYSEFRSEVKSRNCIGGIVSQRALEDQYGLTPAQARDFFRNPITLRFGVAGESRMADFVNYFYGIRLYGDS